MAVRMSFLYETEGLKKNCRFVNVNLNGCEDFKFSIKKKLSNSLWNIGIIKKILRFVNVNACEDFKFSMKHRDKKTIWRFVNVKDMRMSNSLWNKKTIWRYVNVNACEDFKLKGQWDIYIYTGRIKNL